MNKRPNQNGFPESACPIGPVSEFEKDSRFFYFALLFKQTYQGRYKPAGDSSRGLRKLRKSSSDRLEFSGKSYRNIPGPEVVWQQAEDDGEKRSRKPGNGLAVMPRHFHADFEFRKKRVHVDFLKFVRWGPLSVAMEYIVFSEGRFVTRGANWNMPPACGYYNWPLAALIGNSLITLEGPREMTDTVLAVPRIEFWIPAE